MKKIFVLFAAALMCVVSCADSKQALTVTVTNPLALDRAGEMVEVPMSDVVARLKLADTAQIVVLDADGRQVPYQVTYDEKVIFPAAVTANGTAVYTIQQGTPEPFNVIACGKYYPERLDDVAWENDLGGYRAYGPALQARGERGFGYDLFTKYNTTEPVLESMYAEELNKEKRAKIAELKKTDPKAAGELGRSISYHIDHGYGMDAYTVGPTMGAGVPALMEGKDFVYPLCYKEVEILDMGPLRFSARMVFAPVQVGQDKDVVETRVITLDKGTHLNKCEVAYANLSEARKVAAGIAVHKSMPDAYVMNKKLGYVAYADAMDHPEAMNGLIYIACLFPEGLKSVEYVPMAKEEAGAVGHVVGVSNYEPGDTFTYYFGSAWSKYDMPDMAVWQENVERYGRQLKTPLAVTLK